VESVLCLLSIIIVIFWGQLCVKTMCGTAVISKVASG